MLKVVFIPSYKETACKEGSTILDVARESVVYIDSACGGIGKCGKCKIRVVSGECSPIVPEESEQIGPGELGQGFRLACRAQLQTDAVIFIPEKSIFKGAASRKEFVPRKIPLKPAVKTYRLDAGQNPSEHRSALERILALLKTEHGIEGLACDEELLAQLGSSLTENVQKYMLSVWMDKEIIRVQTGMGTGPYGIALDVGTTTLALYLCSLETGKILASASATNPQTIFGEDIMSRIVYSVHHPGEGVKRMQRELINTINTMVHQVIHDKRLTADNIVDMTVVGNTVMHHIFLGLPPDRLGYSPFTPLIENSVNIKARDLGLDILPAAYVHVLPVEAGFVGPDNVAVLIAEEPYARDEFSLVIDIGTNGELAVGNRSRLLSCSCATGPALEGAEIVYGMRAAPGAIEKAKISPKGFEVDYKVIGNDRWKSDQRPGKFKPVGICGSGIIDAIAGLYQSGLILKNGAFSQKAQTPRLRKGKDGTREFVLAWAKETPIDQDIVVTQRDVRQIQLAKGAIRAGCQIMMERLGISGPDRLIIAGAFGMHLDRDNALAIGLFPECDPEAISFVGNAAGHGAYLALINIEEREEADRIARWTEHIELATEKAFQEEFIKALAFPDSH
ncbi:MAG TPA: ASKHA domain-containing protein [Syntrophorhabdales bacterium]|nr:ASKHA domain-containing protein [Syntrophorhabdales bacterium]